MANIPMRFKRVAAAFDEMARARLCESSGSEHSPENSLAELVNSFIERDFFHDDKFIDEEEEAISKQEKESFDSEKMSTLKGLFGNFDNDEVRRNVVNAVESAYELLGESSSSQGFKRLLMARLRENGLDAGLCKSKWEKSGSFPAGTYEYIDINVSGNRYIVEIMLAGQFEITRPTSRYASLLNIFPQIFVGKLEELKQVIRLMCSSLRDSLKKADMRVPPWRKNGYMQSKWFGSYKRTVNSVSTKATLSESDDGFADRKRSIIGFEAPSSTLSSYCRYEFGSKGAFKVGYLAAAFQ